MPEQHMYFEEVNAESSQISSNDYDQNPSYKGYASQINVQKRVAQEEEKELTVQQRSGFAIFSLVLFMVVVLVSLAMANNLSAFMFAEITLIASVIIIFIIIILFNVLLKFYSSTKNNEPSIKQRLTLSITSMLLLIVVLFSSVISAMIAYYSQDSIYTYITLILGSSLYLLIVIVINILFNSKRLERNRGGEPH